MKRLFLIRSYLPSQRRGVSLRFSLFLCVALRLCERFLQVYHLKFEIKTKDATNRVPTCCIVILFIL